MQDVFKCHSKKPQQTCLKWFWCKEFREHFKRREVFKCIKEFFFYFQDTIFHRLDLLWIPSISFFFSAYLKRCYLPAGLSYWTRSKEQHTQEGFGLVIWEQQAPVLYNSVRQTLKIFSKEVCDMATKEEKKEGLIKKKASQLCILELEVLKELFGTRLVPLPLW